MPPPACARSAGTSRARPSCQSGSAGSPLRRRAMLSSTELAGRGAGQRRVELGGRDGLHPLGIGAGLGQHRPHEAPPGGGAAVGHVEDPGPAVEPEGHDGGRQVGGEGRRPVLVVDEAQLAVALGQAQGGDDHVGAVGAAQPARAHDGRPGPALALARQLGGAVDRGRARGVPLPVGRGRRCRRRRSRSTRRRRARRPERRPRRRGGCRWRSRRRPGRPRSRSGRPR